MTWENGSATCASMRSQAIAYSRFQVYQDGPRDVSGIVALVEKDVFPVAPFGRKVLQVAILANAVFLAKLLPELAANLSRRQHNFSCQVPSQYRAGD